jgi:stearoyl-CoA desaturase (Delta-9 desaturase)
VNWLFGLYILPWWGYAIILLTFTQLTILSVTIYLHRCQAHRAVELHPAISHLFRFWLWLTTAMVTKEWTAVHRKHHAKVETADDPHSPQVKGIKKVFFEGAELYREEADNKETLERYGNGTPDDWLERNIYTPHSVYGVSLMLIINLLLFGVVGLLMWSIQMAWIPLFAAGVVNGLGHYIGYRNFEPQDASRNLVPFGLLIGGEELHNNHHAYATSAKFSAKWWEVDIGWGVIRCLQFFHLAKPKRTLPKPKMMPGKSNIDNDTITALITYRLQVMARYTREVIMPALQDEKRRAGNTGNILLARAKTLLIRDQAIMPLSQKSNLSKLLDNFQGLRTVYDLRLKLQDIWQRSTASQKELVEALQEWCRQAEATGIERLAHFVAQLKTYVPSSEANNV